LDDRAVHRRARASSWEYAARSATCVGFSTYAASRAPIATRHLSSSWLASISRCADTAALGDIGERSFRGSDAEKRSRCSIAHPLQDTVRLSSEWRRIVCEVVEEPRRLPSWLVGAADDGERDGPGARRRDLVRQRAVARAQSAGRWTRLGEVERRRRRAHPAALERACARPGK